MPLHYAGVGCELDPICALAAEHGAVVVEDNAHGLFGRYRGRLLGTFGELATRRAFTRRRTSRAARAVRCS